MSEKIIPVPLGMVSAFAIVGKEVILVDSGMPEHGPVILDKLASENIKPEDIKLIVITHGHMDHFGGARFLKEKTGAKILIHSQDALALKNGFSGFPRSFNLVGAFISALVRTFRWLMSFVKAPPVPSGVEPDITIDGEYDLKEFGIEGRIIPTPGHTPGAISVLLKQGDIFVGDLIGSFLKKNQPTLPLWGNSEKQIRQSVKKVMGLCPSMVYPSHVRAFSRKEMEVAFWNYF
ncbi:MAG: MBL fold metallo-hydrolase [Candidatus Riflebacteria bacterium]|nr:MBL fold metallo-hydrolase [Candidatus Riflebacteria bacterium]